MTRTIIRRDIVKPPVKAIIRVIVSVIGLAKRDAWTFFTNSCVLPYSVSTHLRGTKISATGSAKWVLYAIKYATSFGKFVQPTHVT